MEGQSVRETWHCKYKICKFIFISRNKALTAMYFYSSQQLNARERRALLCNEALKEKFAAHQEVRRIARHRQVPKHIYNARAELRTIREKNKRKYV